MYEYAMRQSAVLYLAAHGTKWVTIAKARAKALQTQGNSASSEHRTLEITREPRETSPASGRLLTALWHNNNNSITGMGIRDLNLMT